ncbi:MAG: tRNA 2-thiouridine(34) synthase MnmA [Thermodesulfobacteriota bacterium]|nr:tRNA 2-thiouridine(34) synthase MnmA [Thermodesulfobacteriota bacterium]
MKKTVAVALSGGLDSAIAAVLLKEQGYRVIGVHFQTGYEATLDAPIPSKNSSLVHAKAQRAADQIGIPLEVMDCHQPFRREVVDYFVHTYRSGQTPSPCLVCNERIKFGLVLEHAGALGASAFATGHYVRIGREEGGGVSLLRGVDQGKDQSYFLARLTQGQLSQAMFPLGSYRKDQVRDMAKARGFTSFVERESQELCFIRQPNYKEFLCTLAGFCCKPGAIVNPQGHVLGTHQGLHAYTVGQRRGIGIPGPEPYYVVRLDNEKNRLIVGTESDLARRECVVVGINWITRVPGKPLSVHTRIRYRHRQAASVMTPLGSQRAKVVFSEPQLAITPGQAAVFYQGERVLGGGWIAATSAEEREGAEHSAHGT